MNMLFSYLPAPPIFANLSVPIAPCLPAAMANSCTCGDDIDPSAHNFLSDEFKGNDDASSITVAISMSSSRARSMRCFLPPDTRCVEDEEADG